MRSPEWEKYVKDILSYVKFKYDHNDIYFEIMEHMEDLYNELVDEGIDENEAIKLTVEYMGDSKEIGRALNKEHNPFIGWIYRILKYCVVLLVVLNIIPVFTLVLSVFSSIHSFFWINENIEEEGKNIAVIQEIDETRKIDDIYIFFDKLVRYDDGNIKIIYSIFQNPFSFSTKWTNGNIGKVYDENNNEYSFNGAIGGGSYYSYYENNIEDFPENSEKFIIKYDYSGRKYVVEISMEKEE